MIEPTVVPTTSSRVESQAANSASNDGSNTAPTEQASDVVPTISTGQPSAAPEPLVLANSGTAGSSTGGMA